MMPTQSSSVTQEAHAAIRPGQIRFYLEMQGYCILDLYQLPNSENYESHTILNGVPYLTTIIVKGDQIIDHEDSSI
jgi:hypothetical protein